MVSVVMMLFLLDRHSVRILVRGGRITTDWLLWSSELLSDSRCWHTRAAFLLRNHRWLAHQICGVDESGSRRVLLSFGR